MFYRQSKQLSLLKINDYFATLKNIDGTNVKFEFLYSISQVEALKHNTYKVKVIVRTNKVKKDDFFVQKGNSIDANKLVNNILSSFSSAKNLISKNIDSEVTSIDSDVTAKIDNSAIEKIKTSIETGKKILVPSKPKLKVVPVKTIKQNNDNKFILEKINITQDQFNSDSSYSNENPKKISHDLILNEGIDPAIIDSNISKKFSNSFQMVQSLSPHAQSIKSFKEEVLDKHIFYKLNQTKNNIFSKNVFELDDEELVTVLSTENSDMIDVPVSVSFIYNSELNYSVEFCLIDRITGEPIETVIKPLDVYLHINNFTTPSKKPVIKVIKSFHDKITSLEITQMDPFANKVNVYTKVIHTDVPKSDYYTLYATFDLKMGQSVNVAVNNPSKEQIFRVIPASDNQIGTIFSSSVLKPNVPSRLKSLAITSSNVINGIKIEVKNIPDNVVAVQILRKNLSMFETKYNQISTYKILNPGNILTFQQSSFNFIDQFVFDSHVYEYAAKLEYIGGGVVIAGNEIIECVTEKPGKIDVRIENLQFDENQNDVTFNVNLLIKDEDIQNIKNLLDSQGFNSYFDDDLSKQRDQVKNLIAYSVERINLSNGERENLGIHSNQIFIDSQASKKYNAKNLESGTNYKYAVKALLRVPETLIKNFKKVIVNPINKKKYSFSPYTSHHPISLKKGTIVTANSLKTHYSKSDLEHGDIGCTAYANVSIPTKKPFITALKAVRFDKNKILISCIIEGNLNKVDHIVISKKIGSSAYVRIGSMHSSFANNICEYIYYIENDVGSITFSAILVNNDYTHGNTVNSNSILVQLWQILIKVQMVLQFQIQP